MIIYQYRRDGEHRGNQRQQDDLGGDRPLFGLVAHLRMLSSLYSGWGVTRPTRRS